MPPPSKEARLILALEALQKDENLTLRAAAKIYDVSRTTLTQRRVGRLPRRDLPANSRRLTDSKDEAIVRYVLELDPRSFPPSVTGFPLLWSWSCHRFRPLLMHTSQASAPVVKVWSHAHSCHLALALFVAISILYVRADQTLGGAPHTKTVWCGRYGQPTATRT
jgi:hypothetical protein